MILFDVGSKAVYFFLLWLNVIIKAVKLENFTLDVPAISCTHPGKDPFLIPEV